MLHKELCLPMLEELAREIERLLGEVEALAQAIEQELERLERDAA